MGQFDIEKVKLAVAQNAKIKIMFNTSGANERERMMEDMGYGGDITPKMAAYANADLPQQHAIIKKNKDKPVRIRIPDTPDAKGDYKKFIDELMKSELYHTKEQITKQINARKLRAYSKSFGFRKADDRDTNRKTSVSRGMGKGTEQGVSQDIKKPEDSGET